MTEDRSPHLIWGADGAPTSGRFGDVYFSRDDGLAESRAVFLHGSRLPETWRDRSRFTVAELGFGTGLNIAALLDLWRRERPPGSRLQIFSVEGFPLSRDEAARALAPWPGIADAAKALLTAWPAPTPGFHRLDLPGFDATLDLAVGDATWALQQWAGRADAWFLDGFSPASNPGMWSDAVFDALAERSEPGARVATFTVAGAVRRALAERGFVVEKRAGHGRKRERLEATLPGSAPTEASPSVAIVGAGIASAALAKAFNALGVCPTILEAVQPGAGGSGFPSALVTPRLDVGDARVAALYASALSRAVDLYSAVPNAVIARGVLQLEQSPRDAGRFLRIAAQDIWPTGAMTVLDPAGCSERLSEAVETTGLLMRDAAAVRPAAILQHWLAGSDMMAGRLARLERADGQWRLLSPSGEILLSADIVVIAAGWSDQTLTALPLTPVLGQANWVDSLDVRPVAWGDYVAPTGEGALFGATHDRNETEVRTSEAASARNLEAVRNRLPRLADRLSQTSLHARAAIRATTPDRLPAAGRLDDDLHVLTGLGSRGFCAAPLLAEHVAAVALGAPSPLPRDLAGLVDPLRFK